MARQSALHLDPATVGQFDHVTALIFGISFPLNEVAAFEHL